MNYSFLAKHSKLTVAIWAAIVGIAVFISVL